MKFKNFFLQFCVSLGFVSALIGQRFPCDGKILIGSSDGVSTTIFHPTTIPFNPTVLSPIYKYFNQTFDALGFNSNDNYIYGVQVNTNHIVKLKSDNSFEVIGAVSIVDTLRSFAGDCTPEGLYLCHDYKLNQILVFDVVDSFRLLKRINLFWDPQSVNSGPFTTRIFDFSIDPNNPNFAYCYQGTANLPELGPMATKGFMLQINLNFNDPNLGMVTPVKRIPQNMATHMDALAFSPRSNLFGYGTTDTLPYPLQNTLFTINANAGQTSLFVINGPKTKYSDGCSCPFSFTFGNSVPTDGIYCSNDEKTFVLRIDYNAYITIKDVILRDTFPKGMIITEISNSFLGNITAGTGLGTNILEITGLQIPAKSRVEIRIKIKTVDTEVGNSYNQAFLYNLPARYNGEMMSDDQSTPGSENDASRYNVIPRELVNVTWKITFPSDCINANDGQITIFSKQFFPGQEFEIGLRNKIGYTETVSRVTVDNTNSLTVKSLLPGDYQVFNLRSLSDNCSLALRDTTILLEAPNDKLKLKLASNGPICEGEPLLLNSTFTDGASIWWTGPDRFGSDAQNPIIESAIKAQSGTYKAVAEYGYCSQTATLAIDIKPTIKASIIGKSIYCVRDTLLLRAASKNDSIKYTWTRPDKMVSKDSILLILSVRNEESGYYELIANNGACSDTVGIDVKVQPTPTLSLQAELTTDFCTPLFLDPAITGDNNVSYTWSPSKGLSCADCPNPQIIPYFESKYHLKVENQFSCSDSSTVEIILDKEKLVFAPNIFKIYSSTGNGNFITSPGCVTNSIHSLEIFDRWGNTVFSTTSELTKDSLSAWDGFIKGQKANSGVYIWKAKIELVDGSIQYLTGDVMLIGGN